MDISVQSQPAPGSTQVGDLDVDQASKQSWLGVDTAVAASGSVLISDIVALQAADTTNLNTAKAYTDSSLTTYAKLASPVFTGTPTAPTPVSTDNDTSLATTAFVKTALAATASPFVAGMIMLWSGALTSIGVGNLAGWALCDGQAGRPDLRDRFILGAGNKVPGTKNSLASATTNVTGAHAHVVTAYALKVADLPVHSHPLGTLDGTVAASDVVSNATGTGAARGPASATTKLDVVLTGATGNTGSGTAHTHGMSNLGDHSHVTTPLA